MPTKQELLSSRSTTSTSSGTTSCRWSMRCSRMAFSARDLARAADIYDRMLRDTRLRRDPLPGRLADLGRAEAGVHRHDPQPHGGRDRQHRGEHRRPGLLRGPRLPALHRRRAAQERHVRQRCSATCTIDRIYDTLIDEDELRICDETVKQIADALPPRPYSSREFIHEMGEHLEDGTARPQRFDRAGRLSERRADLLPGVFRLLGGPGHRRPLSRAAAQAEDAASTAPRTSTS